MGLSRPSATFLDSRVARRLFWLFLVCGLAPIVVLGLVAHRSVTHELKERGGEEISRLSRDFGYSMLERTSLLADYLARSVGTGVAGHADDPAPDAVFRRSWFVPGEPASRLTVPGTGDVKLNELQLAAFAVGEPLLIAKSKAGSPLLVLGTHAVSPSGESGIAWAVLDSDYFWWGSPRSSEMFDTDVTIFDSEGETLVTTLADRPAVEEMDNVLGAFEWHAPEEKRLLGYWRAPQRYGDITIAVSRPLVEVMAPLASFSYVFPLVVLATILTVALASVSQIRRSLVPLERLMAGTEEIAAGNFDVEVDVASGDEFEDLARSFTDMADTLGLQFQTLETVGNLGRTALATVAPEEIVESTLAGIAEVVRSDWVAATLLSDDSETDGMTYFRRGRRHDALRTGMVRLTPDELARLELDNELHGTSDMPKFVASFLGGRRGSYHALPLRLDSSIAAILTVGFDDCVPIDRQQVRRMRRIAEQTGVALSNARLVGELESLSRGTLVALARAVDAKSPWTGGHSERVADIGLRIGIEMGLGPDEQDVLYRGGLLHDIGKIGIPLSVLDKPGRLNEEERLIMESHPTLGVRILEPIKAFADVLPIVWEHHEWYDGGGYPRGLKGEEISLHGRIFGVADVFDALRSARPYRTGVPLGRVVKIIESEANSHFDPDVVRAFRSIIPFIDHGAYDEEMGLPEPVERQPELEGVDGVALLRVVKS